MYSGYKQTIQLRTRYTLDSAISSVNSLTGSYNNNKAFVDHLIFDGILTENDCKDARGVNTILGNLGGALLQKDMSWLKKLLLSKKASLITTSSSQTNSCVSLGGTICNSGGCQGNLVRSFDSNNCCLGTCVNG
jgi:hypothetical protein